MYALTNKNETEKCIPYRVIRENPSLNVSMYSFGERLFSMLNSQYEPYLMQEIYGLRCIVKFSLDEILDMPIADRRMYIFLHNDRINRENNQISENHSTKDNINEVRDLANKAETQRQKSN